MTNILLIINTAILIILFGDKLASIIKSRFLDKTELDEKVIAAIKELVGKIKK